MLSRTILILAALLALVTRVSAQTVTTYAWEYDVPLAEVATITQTVSIDGGAPLATAPNCIAKPGDATKTQCSIPIPNLAPGPHTLLIVAAKNGMTMELRFAGVDPVKGPPPPVRSRVTVTITITAS